MKIQYNNNFIILDFLSEEEEYLYFKYKVSSWNFWWEHTFCLLKSQIALLYWELLQCYKQLRGEIMIQDNEDDNYFKIDFEKYGRVKITGQIWWTYNDHCLKYSFEADQTVIPPLMKDVLELIELQ